MVTNQQALSVEEAKALSPSTLRENMLKKWTKRIETASILGEKAAWTFKLIHRDVIKDWIKSAHGEMSFHLTQMMSGHGCFNTYLNRIKRAPTSGCAHCGPPGEIEEVKDDPSHILLYCEAFESERQVLISKIGSFWATDIVPRMLESPEKWSAVTEFADKVLRTKGAAAERE